jgi:ribosomal protein L12E/L44/L45/RPP1/RPP2
MIRPAAQAAPAANAQYPNANAAPKSDDDDEDDDDDDGGGKGFFGKIKSILS